MSWETTRGLLSKYRGTIKQAKFLFDPRYNDGQTLLIQFLVATDNDETPETTESYPCGNGWTSEDGKRAFRKDGGDQFNRGSWYGRLIETVKADEGAIKALTAKGDPTEAAIWVGTAWDFDEIEVDFGGEIGVKSRTMPVTFIGEGEAAQSSPAPSQGASGSNGSDDALTEQLREIAGKSADHAEFVREALKVDGVQAVIDKVADQSDQGLYAQLKG